MARWDDAPPLRRDAARNRERVLEAAAEVFAEHGLQASVEDVARVAGVGMGTLYRRFPTKEALIAELVREVLVGLLDDARTARAEPGGRGLRAFLYAVGERQAARTGALPRLWSTVEHAALIGEIRAEIATLLADAQHHGLVRTDVTAFDVSTATWALRGIIETTHEAAPDAWRRHLDLLFAGLEPASL